MTTERDRIQERYAFETHRIDGRLDLDAFLALSSDDRATRWRQFDLSAKQDAVIQQLARAGFDWDEATVAHWVRHYDAKWEAARPDSDLAIPPASDIMAIAQERSGTAQQHEDWAGAAQLNRVRVNVQRGARLSWHLGDLLIQSVNNPGQVYSVNRRGCTCKNGQAGRSSCWHVAVFDLLLDLQDEAASTADAAAERARAAELGRRLCAARAKALREMDEMYPSRYATDVFALNLPDD